MSLHVNGQVISNEKIAPQYFLMQIEVPSIASVAKPGQFVHVRVSETLDPLLRRPISLHAIDADKGTITLLYQVVGRGTEMLSRFAKSQAIDLMGPLGNGFSVPKAAQNITIVGGGIGVAPLFPLLEQLSKEDKKIKVILGARNRSALLGLDKLKATGLEAYLATDDGSIGVKGFVTDILIEENKKLLPDYIFACGPELMLARVAEIAKATNIPGQVSLEERMGCGVGACLSCVCQIKSSEGNEIGHKKVCNDGPVFDLREVVFHD